MITDSMNNFMDVDKKIIHTIEYFEIAADKKYPRKSILKQVTHGLKFAEASVFMYGVVIGVFPVVKNTMDAVINEATTYKSKRMLKVNPWDLSALENLVAYYFSFNYFSETEIVCKTGLSTGKVKEAMRRCRVKSTFSKMTEFVVNYRKLYIDFLPPF